MADFCKQCAEELGFESDFTNLFRQSGDEPDGGETGFVMLCETCGPQCFVIDDEGTCGSGYCNGSLHNPGPHAQSMDMARCDPHTTIPAPDNDR